MSRQMENLLSRLDKVKKGSKPGSYIACCSGHDDRNPSLVITENDEGAILVWCGAGCSAYEIVAGAGLEISDLFPPRNTHHSKPQHRPFPAADILRVIAFEALIVATSGAALLSGEPFTETDRERLMLAVSRIQSGLTASGVSHG